MPTIAELQTKLRKFDSAAREAEGAGELQEEWKRLFGQTLSENSAKSFADYYREMRTRSRSSRRMHGGAAMELAPATLSYQMTPGMSVMNYGRFPIESSADIVRDLDVYFRDSLTADCGKTSPYPTAPPAGMGSNQVGGSRRRRRMTLVHGRRHKNGKKTLRRRRQRGGNLMESMSMRLFNASAPPSFVQSVSNSWTGGTSPVPAPADPSIHTWKLAGTSGSMINPGLISNVSNGLDKLATPAPWQTS